MSTCWKCERELPEGQTECEYGCGAEQSGELAQRMLKLYKDSAPIDWDKIQSFADLKELFQALYEGHRFHADSYPALAKFLKRKGSK